MQIPSRALKKISSSKTELGGDSISLKITTMTALED